MSVALLYANDRGDATEIVNDSFIKIFKEIRKFDTSMSFKSWFRRIVINTAIDRFRKESRKRTMIQVDELPVHDTEPGVISKISAEEIFSLLNNLPLIHKTIFCLYEIEGYSHEEIAKELKIPESSCRVYLTRAKKRLQELYRLHFNS
ncbi:ECF RNA polymerase sigma factor SigE [bioreactor metagenome]|uniref:ECF RNA polymerase sigma factor SigE n=1 Tax=bioreactor metagenome TaxID=1076179 RepID=A0A645ITN0_9ZZZZ